MPLGLLARIGHLLAKEVAKGAKEISESGGIAGHIIKYSWKEYECSHEDKKNFYNCLDLLMDGSGGGAKEAALKVEDDKLRALLLEKVGGEPESAQWIKLHDCGNFFTYLNLIGSEHGEGWLSQEEALIEIESYERRFSIELDHPSELAIVRRGETRQPRTAQGYQQEGIEACRELREIVLEGDRSISHSDEARKLKRRIDKLYDERDYRHPRIMLQKAVQLEEELHGITKIYPDSKVVDIDTESKEYKVHSHLGTKLGYFPDELPRDVYEDFRKGNISHIDGVGLINDIIEATKDPETRISDWRKDELVKQCKNLLELHFSSGPGRGTGH